MFLYKKKEKEKKLFLRTLLVNNLIGFNSMFEHIRDFYVKKYNWLLLIEIKEKW